MKHQTNTEFVGLLTLLKNLIIKGYNKDSNYTAILK